jgi:hypothetical protein
MKLEDQVTSLELSKKLKELGVKQESLCFWEQATQTKKNGELIWYLGTKDLPNSDWCSAFSVAELGEMLPDYVSTYKREGQWIADASLHRGGEIPLMGSGTEADARAYMLIYLIENKLI